ncbi:MAG: CPBP family intramembrane metalloprotease, partial [Acidobacteria bacterium]|nr:CPBP family intramembrane metalloprotease [Acidobacteriota bacterium]
HPQKDIRWGPLAGLATWVTSVALLIGLQLIALAIYLFIRYRETGTVPVTFELDQLMAILTIALTFPAHLLTLVVCWLVITDRGRRPFRQAIGWAWHPQFRWIHAVAFAFLMLGVAFSFEKLLPHRETDMEKLLRMGATVRYLVAALAVLTAPLVEELVYRGILYAGIEKRFGAPMGVAVVTLLFALVHVPQYWGSVAAISAILTLSLALTLLRSFTGRILPCIAIHLVYNGIQAVGLLVGDESMQEVSPAKTALVLLRTLISSIV